MILSPSQARLFYDRFGKKQDTQAFYEDAALDELVTHANFAQAASVFELGCGTGRFAAELLANHLPPTASYLGIDISQTMISLAQPRLAAYAGRASVVESNGAMTFPLADHSVDRVVSTYVLDLLSEEDIRLALREAHRVLTSEGKLCLVSLTQGNTFGSRATSRIWSTVCRLRPSLVGGCRPVQLEAFIDTHSWFIEHQQIIRQFSVPSEVLIARPQAAG